MALAAGRLMKLSRGQMVEAVNLALNDHIPMGQTRTQTNSDWKGLADAEAERAAAGEREDERLERDAGPAVDGAREHVGHRPQG